MCEEVAEGHMVYVDQERALSVLRSGGRREEAEASGEDGRKEIYGTSHTCLNRPEHQNGFHGRLSAHTGAL